MDNAATPTQFRGRLLMAAVHNAYHGNVIVFSDDGGKTYSSSKSSLAIEGLDEVSIAQVSTFSTLLSSWFFLYGPCPLRGTGTSTAWYQTRVIVGNNKKKQAQKCGLLTLTFHHRLCTANDRVTRHGSVI